MEELLYLYAGRILLRHYDCSWHFQVTEMGVASLSTWRLSILETCSSVGINVIMGS